MKVHKGHLSQSHLSAVLILSITQGESHAYVNVPVLGRRPDRVGSGAVLQEVSHDEADEEAGGGLGRDRPRAGGDLLGQRRAALRHRC